MVQFKTIRIVSLAFATLLATCALAQNDPRGGGGPSNNVVTRDRGSQVPSISQAPNAPAPGSVFIYESNGKNADGDLVPGQRQGGYATAEKDLTGEVNVPLDDLFSDTPESRAIFTPETGATLEVIKDISVFPDSDQSDLAEAGTGVCMLKWRSKSDERTVLKGEHFHIISIQHVDKYKNFQWDAHGLQVFKFSDAPFDLVCIRQLVESIYDITGEDVKIYLPELSAPQSVAVPKN